MKIGLIALILSLSGCLIWGRSDDQRMIKISKYVLCYKGFVFVFGSLFYIIPICKNKLAHSGVLVYSGTYFTYFAHWCIN